MPTENRSSNTDLSQVEASSSAMTQIRTMLGREQRPDQVAAALEACDWSETPIGNKAIILSAIRALRATQHQGEPVTLPVAMHPHDFDNLPEAHCNGWNACLDEIAKLGPLYAHPVQGEPVARVEIGADRNACVTITDDNWLRGLKDKALHQVVQLYTHPAPAEQAEVIDRLKELVGKGATDERANLRGEVERLQRRVQNADLALKAQTQNCETLRTQLAETEQDRKRLRDNNVELSSVAGKYQAQLAERDALFARILGKRDACAASFWFDEINALSASAEPKS